MSYDALSLIPVMIPMMFDLQEKSMSACVLACVEEWCQLPIDCLVHRNPVVPPGLLKYDLGRDVPVRLEK